MDLFPHVVFQMSAERRPTFADIVITVETMETGEEKEKPIVLGRWKGQIRSLKKKVKCSHVFYSTVTYSPDMSFVVDVRKEHTFSDTKAQKHTIPLLSLESLHVSWKTNFLKTLNSESTTKYSKI